MSRRLVAALLALVLVGVGCAPVDEAPPDDPVEPETAGPIPSEPTAPTEPADPPPPDPDPGPPLAAYGVSAGDTTAVDAGMAVLEAGGNAVDAAVAAAFAVSVAEPFASGIGGGGAAVIAGLDQAPLAYDYREVVAADGRIPATNTGIPGFVAGMAALQADLGTLDLGAALEPAIALARDGTPASSTLASHLRTAAHRLPVGQLPHFYPGGTALDAGDLLVQEELADTLERLAAEGPEVFYRGDLAEQLSAVDGIDPASLGAYEVQVSTPPSGSFARFEVVAAAPPLPGAALIQMLQVAEAAGIADQPPGTADHIHTLAMSWRLADQYIAWDLGDPDFVDVPVDVLTDHEANAELAGLIDPDRLLPIDPGRPRGGLTGNTTHLTVVDTDGLMVSMTNTITNFWGSGQYVAGFFLNDQLGRFSIGRGDANMPEADRRSVSWSLPAIVLDGAGRPVLGIGSPGGRRIPNMLSQTIVRWALHDQSLAEAVAAGRFHLEADGLELEALPDGAVADDLRARGYRSLTVPDPPFYFGSIQALEVDHDTGEVVGARDERRDADWAVGRP